jgi:hypothetical protein
MSLADVSGLSPFDIYQTLEFESKPVKSANTYVTYGLSRRTLVDNRQLDPMQFVRMELLAVAYKSFEPASIAYLLMSFGNAILRKGEAPVNGEVISWPIFDNDRFRYIYCTEPLLLPERLGLFNGSSPPTVIAWLFPITELEAEYARSVGMTTFNDLLRTQKPDVMAYDHRPDMRLPKEA